MRLDGICGRKSSSTETPTTQPTGPERATDNIQVRPHPITLVKTEPVGPRCQSDVLTCFCYWTWPSSVVDLACGPKLIPWIFRLLRVLFIFALQMKYCATDRILNVCRHMVGNRAAHVVVGCAGTEGNLEKDQNKYMYCISHLQTCMQCSGPLSLHFLNLC